MLELLEPTIRIFDERIEPEPEPQPEPTVYRVRDDCHSPRWGYLPRQLNLKCPPMVNPMYVNTNTNHGTARTPMNRYGWEEHLRKLNGDKFDQAVADGLAMFNGGGWPNMESLLFGCNLVRAVPADKWGWMRIVTLDYYAGPPSDLPTYEDDPIAVQKFTMICRGGAVISRNPELYYPVVSRDPVYYPLAWLEPLSDDMETPPPP